MTRQLSLESTVAYIYLVRNLQVTTIDLTRYYVELVSLLGLLSV